MIVVANKYQYGRFGKTIDKSVKKTLREGMKLDEKYVEEQNERMKENGIYYVIDEEATKEWREEHEQWRKEMKAKEQLNKQASKDILGELITDAVSGAGKKQPKEDSELEEARELYREKFGKEPHGRAKAEKLLTEIKEHNENQ